MGENNIASSRPRELRWLVPEVEDMEARVGGEETEQSRKSFKGFF